DWLTASPANSINAFCKYCKNEIKTHKRDLQVHAQAKKHKNLVKEQIENATTPKITLFAKKTISEKRKIAEMKLATFVAEHCSINSIDHLGFIVMNLDSKFEFLKYIKLHRTKCTSLMKNVIAPCMLADLVNDIGDEFYSAIVDESTAVDTKKLLCIMIRYFSKAKEKVVTSFYRLIEIETADAESLFQVFTNQLKNDNLKLENLGIGVDGANVMVGEHNSFSSKLKFIIPHLVTVKCLYGKKPKKIAKLSGTRWLARNEAIKTILSQWDHFKLVAEKERCYTAEQLYEMYNDEDNRVYLIFLSSVLSKVTALNKDVDEAITEWNLLHTKLVLALMSLPFSNASVERIFSIINIIKDKLRNRMSVETADTILRIRSNLPNGCIAFEPTEDMLNKFNSETMYSSNFVEEILDSFIEC
ncbi:hypothetical protein ALC57_13294, partial [Trachymyrmex cornetzi]